MPSSNLKNNKMKDKMIWRFNTPEFFREVSNNIPQMSALRAPLVIFRSLLIEVGERAIELNDPKLNALMIRLSLYSISDPYDKDYDPKLVNEILYGKSSPPEESPLET